MSPFLKIVLRVTALSGLIFFSACALLGGGGETLTRAKGYSVTPPKNWKTVSSGDADSAYQLPSGNLATLTSSCNRSEAPLEALTRHLLFGVRQVQVLERRKFSIHGANALLSRIKGTYEGKPVEMLVCVVAKDDCVFDFVMLTPKRITEGDASEFARFVESFSYGK